MALKEDSMNESPTCAPPLCPKCKHGNPGLRYVKGKLDTVAATCYNCNYKWTFPTPPPEPEPEQPREAKTVETASDEELMAEARRRKLVRG